MAFLTNDEKNLFDEKYPIGTNQYIQREGRSSILIEVVAQPLLILAESAALGHRVYEFLSISRPGDIQHYLQLKIIDVHPEIQSRVNRKWHAWNESGPVDTEVLQYAAFDALFYSDGHDTSGESESWLAHRQGSAWQNRLLTYYEVVKTLQTRLRQVDDSLLQHEISLIDQSNHRLDSLANIERIYQTTMRIDEPSSFSEEMLSLVSELVKRDDVQSVSCSTMDHHFWRIMVSEQVKRAQKTGLPYMHALGLCGTDGREDLIFAVNNWGGDIHSPYEGITSADLFIKPHWHTVYPEAWEKYGGLFAAHGPCQYLLTEIDYGEVSCAARSDHGDWTLYQSKGPDLPHNPFIQDE